MLTADGKAARSDVAWQLSRESHGMMRVRFSAVSRAYEGLQLEVSNPVFNQQVMFCRLGPEGIAADALIPLSAILQQSDFVVEIFSRETHGPTDDTSRQTTRWKIHLGDVRTTDHSPPVPDAVGSIFQRPGARWTSEEFHAVEDWLADKPQLHYALCVLASKGADASESEEILQEFWEKRLRDVLRKYDPSKGKSMPGYLIMNLAFYCQDCLKRKRKREINLPIGAGSDQGGIEFDIADDGATDAESLLSARQSQRLLLDCIRSLTADQRTAIIRHYFEGVSIKVLAHDMNKREENVKIILHRARRQLAMRLKARGGRI